MEQAQAREWAEACYISKSYLSSLCFSVTHSYLRLGSVSSQRALDADPHHCLATLQDQANSSRLAEVKGLASSSARQRKGRSLAAFNARRPGGRRR